MKWLKLGRYSAFAILWVNANTYIIRQRCEWTGNYRYLINGYCNQSYDSINDAISAIG